MKSNFTGRLFMGLVVIAIGIIVLLRQLEIISLSIGEMVSIYWPVILIFLGVSKLRSINTYDGSVWWGAILITIGCIFLGNNLDLISWTIGDIVPYAIPLIIIIIGLRMLLSPRSHKESPPSEDWKSYRSYRDDNVPPAPPLHPDPTKEQAPKETFRPNSATHDEHVEWWNHNDKNAQNRSGFIGDIHMGHDYWELKPLNISHFIGDTVLDLTKAQIPYGETKITISSFIGDVKVYVPNDYEIGVQVICSAFVGDVKVFGEREGGLFTSVNTKTPSFVDAEKKIKLIVSTFIGDTRVTKVG